MVIVSLARLLVAALAVGAASAHPPGVQPPAAGGKYGFKRDWYAARALPVAEAPPSHMTDSSVFFALVTLSVDTPVCREHHYSLAVPSIHGQPLFVLECRASQHV